MKPLSDVEARHLTALAGELVKTCAALAVTRQRARDFRSDGHKPSTQPQSGSRAPGHPDPVGNAALDTRPDPTAQYEQRLTDAVRATVTAIERLQAIDRLINSHGKLEPRESRVFYCANIWCGDTLILADGQTPDRGRCAPCATYLAANDRDASRTVIATRRRVREHREGNT